MSFPSDMQWANLRPGQDIFTQFKIAYDLNSWEFVLKAIFTCLEQFIEYYACLSKKGKDF